jgi:hypothetical protein
MAMQKSLIGSMGERIPQGAMVAEITVPPESAVGSVDAMASGGRFTAAQPPGFEELPGAAVGTLPGVEVEPGENDALKHADPVIARHGVFAAPGTKHVAAVGG